MSERPPKINIHISGIRPYAGSDPSTEPRPVTPDEPPTIETGIPSAAAGSHEAGDTAVHPPIESVDGEPSSRFSLSGLKQAVSEKLEARKDLREERREEAEKRIGSFTTEAARASYESRPHEEGYEPTTRKERRIARKIDERKRKTIKRTYANRNREILHGRGPGDGHHQYEKPGDRHYKEPPAEDSLRAKFGTKDHLEDLRETPMIRPLRKDQRKAGKKLIKDRDKNNQANEAIEKDIDYSVADEEARQKELRDKYLLKWQKDLL
jgi:hypothetical protein